MGDASPALDASVCDAVVFDMDGVLTDTARLHARAWKQTFDAYLESRAGAGGAAPESFDIEGDYREHVDGRPRYEGVHCFLESRGIELERGDPSDDPDRETVCGLGNRKNQRFLALLRERGAERFDDAVALVRRLRDAGIQTAVISASRNARQVLERVDLAGLFAVRVDGVASAGAELEGRPAPDVFLEAARRLGAPPERCAVIDDAVAGVEAGRRGGFGWVIGVARDGEVERLRGAGASRTRLRSSSRSPPLASGGGR